MKTTTFKQIRKKVALVITLAVAIGLNSNPSKAQAPDWVWAHSESTGLVSQQYGGVSMATDGSGNLYVTGSFVGNSITFGSTTLNNTPNDYGGGLFILKYDASGNLIWAKEPTYTNGDVATSIAVDKQGNAYITGAIINDSITFGNTTFRVTGSYNNNSFIVKYDASGNVKWAKSAIGSVRNAISYVNCSNRVAVDTSGNVFLTGGFVSDSIRFDNYSIPNTYYNYNASVDLFMVKYDTSGNVLWLKGAGGTGSEAPAGITTDNNSNIYITGSSSSLTFNIGGIILHNATANANSFIAKYDSSGNVLWAKGLKGSETFTAIKCDNKNLYFTGDFTDSAFFDTITITNVVPGALFTDVCIAKSDTAGNFLWAKGAGGATFATLGNDIAFDNSGNVYAVGYFMDASITFDNITLTNTEYAWENIFVAKYSSSGSAIWAKGAINGSGNNMAESIVSDASGNTYVSGVYGDSIAFDNIHLPVDNSGYSDNLFLSKLDMAAGISSITRDEINSAVYPNPGNGAFTLLWSNRSYSNMTITLSNTLGEKEYEKRLSSTAGQHSLPLDLSYLSKGIYLLQIQSQEGISSHKVVIQ